MGSQEAEIILGIPLSSRVDIDSLLWHFDRKGLFTVRSAYKLALILRVSNVPSCSKGAPPWWKVLWSLKIPSKIKFFYWRACKNILPTKDSLFKRGIGVSGLCSLCGLCKDSVDHATWGCKVLARCWAGCPFFRSLKNSSFGKVFLMRFIVSLWLAWGFRNSLLHGLGCCGLIDFWARAGELMMEFENAGSVFASDLFSVASVQSSAAAHGQFSAAAPDLVSVFPGQSFAAFISSKIEVGCWSPHSSGFKVNVDAAVNLANRSFGVDIVVRDSSGLLVFAAGQFFDNFFDVESAEAKAIQLGISCACFLQLSRAVIESDALNVVRL
ncbi:hypothetical protein ACOSQ4_005685 [Xanthoceras sorbifolium]